MKKLYLVLILSFIGICSISAQAPNPIAVQKVADYNAAFDPGADSATKARLPYATDLGVRRVIVADANGDGKQEIIATDYSNGGRVHVIAPSESDPNVLEVIWSSKPNTKSSGSTPRFPQVGDLDGDGNLEIIFEQASTNSIQVYEWVDELSLWGTEPAFTMTSDMLVATGTYESPLFFSREAFSVYDFDGDGKSEFVPYFNGLNGNKVRRDVYIFGVDGTFPGFASVVLEGGKVGVDANARSWSGGSNYNTIPADIDGDGKIEIINHVWNAYGFWSIDVKGPDSYIYPDTASPNKANIFNSFFPQDAEHDFVSYFGVRPVDVNGDGRDEIVGSRYGSKSGTGNFDIALMSFTSADTGVYIWKNDSTFEANHIGIIAKKLDLAALAGKTAAEFWPAVGGDINKDGKDEIYTGGGVGMNLIGIQYNGTGNLLDPANYTANLVYAGEGNDVFATWSIYNGEAVYDIDTLYPGTDSMLVDTTGVHFDPSKIDTVKTEVPFTSYIFADSVDIDGDGRMEIIISQQSVYDSVDVSIYNWDAGIEQWAYDTVNSHKIYNDYRKNIIALEYTGGIGVQNEGYTIVTPEDYKLEQNYPNPFNPTTNISFALPIDKKITLKIYDMLGKEVRTLINGELYAKGNHKILWDGKSNGGMRVASGNYIARLEYGTFFKAIKMTLLK